MAQVQGTAFTSQTVRPGSQPAGKIQQPELEPQFPHDHVMFRVRLRQHTSWWLQVTHI